MMKWLEAIEKVSKTDDNDIRFYGSDCLPEELRISDDINFEKLNTRLKEYWVHSWLCTDTWVGYTALFLDNDVVAISYQSARKSSKNYKFVSKDILKQARLWVIECLEYDTDRYATSFLNDGWEQEQTEFNCVYTSQIITRNGYIVLDGEQVPVTAKSFDFGISRTLVVVVDSTGQELTIPTCEYFHNVR